MPQPLWLDPVQPVLTIRSWNTHLLRWQSTLQRCYFRIAQSPPVLVIQGSCMRYTLMFINQRMLAISSPVRCTSCDTASGPTHRGSLFRSHYIHRLFNLHRNRLLCTAPSTSRNKITMFWGPARPLGSLRDKWESVLRRVFAKGTSTVLMSRMRR